MSGRAQPKLFQVNVNSAIALGNDLCTGVHWFANELIKAIVLLEINQLSTRHTSAHL